MKATWRLGAIFIMSLGLLISGKGVYMGGKAVVAQVLLEKAWSEALATGTPTPPWPWMDARPIAEISVPSLNKSAIVLNETSGQALAFGPAHMPQTPHPGENGVSVIAAHKNTHFSFLKDVRKGDAIHITNADGTTQIFTVSGAEIVHKDRSGIATIQETNAAPQIALVTCYPFDAISYGGPMRYVVYAEK